MSHTPHELAEEFPDKAELISQLKQEDAHFARVVDAYHEVNRAIHRAETHVDPVSEEHERALRRKRMEMKDEVHRILSVEC